MRIYMKDRSAELPVLSAVAVPVILTVCTGFETGDGHGRSILPCFMAIIGERAQIGQLSVQRFLFSIREYFPLTIQYFLTPEFEAEFALNETRR